MRPNRDIVYLSGPMSGYPDYNFARFNEWAAKLRDAGYVVINPAETAGGVDHLPREWYFRFDFAMLNIVDYVFLMPGWTMSAGARAEAIKAYEIGVSLFEIHDDGDGVVATLISNLTWDVSFDREAAR